MTDDDELRTETFTSARGWTAVRVTHGPSGTVAERLRSPALTSAVEAQRECIGEIRALLAGEPPPLPEAEAEHPEAPVTRAEFEALAARVNRLEQLGPLAP